LPEIFANVKITRHYSEIIGRQIASLKPINIQKINPDLNSSKINLEQEKIKLEKVNENISQKLISLNDKTKSIETFLTENFGQSDKDKEIITNEMSITIPFFKQLDQNKPTELQSIVKSEVPEKDKENSLTSTLTQGQNVQNNSSKKPNKTCELISNCMPQKIMRI